MIRRWYSPRRGLIGGPRRPVTPPAVQRPGPAEAAAIVNAARITVFSMPDWVPVDLLEPMLRQGGLVDQMDLMLQRVQLGRPPAGVLLDPAARTTGRPVAA